jgi:multicomponent Na+:H+ antiporter subunit C
MRYVAEHYNYWVAILLMMVGLYPVIGKTNLVKKIIGLSIFQTGIFLFFVTIGKVTGGTASVLFNRTDVPWDKWDASKYTNSIPTALILTGIVVSVATMAVALALAVNIKRAYGTIEQDEIDRADGDGPR